MCAWAIMFGRISGILDILKDLKARRSERMSTLGDDRRKTIFFSFNYKNNLFIKPAVKNSTVATETLYLFNPYYLRD